MSLTHPQFKCPPSRTFARAIEETTSEFYTESELDSDSSISETLKYLKPKVKGLKDLPSKFFNSESKLSFDKLASVLKCHRFTSTNRLPHPSLTRSEKQTKGLIHLCTYEPCEASMLQWSKTIVAIAKSRGRLRNAPRFYSRLIKLSLNKRESHHTRTLPIPYLVRRPFKQLSMKDVSSLLVQCRTAVEVASLASGPVSA